MESQTTQNDVASESVAPPASTAQGLASTSEDANENADFLSFCLANELYGVEIKDVEEIRVWERPTPIPRSPDYVKGVINLRGMVVPVVDLRLRFGIGSNDYLPTTVVLVLRSYVEESERLMGLVVDAVSDVVGQGSSELYPAIGDSAVSGYLQGLLNVGDQVMSLFDTEELLNIDKILKVG
ncbi:purine-binding chemotaxis protein CheW [Vibrio sp. SCSIO 43135]|uniref:Chemotaxis protein CheW n=2 Tax=Vibrio paucivorans TaxID=2829489 RepID=A0A9X3CH84_9VIBR|nr:MULTISPECIES: chemotaxis protein CheW [Vibrio]MCW8335716.1 chemotaxis protein CheW [Vibrio paucivorans]USD43372.1 purine-binding chemotaxis protein CheW [Vibrio sp. SCSIO 43135]